MTTHLEIGEEGQVELGQKVQRRPDGQQQFELEDGARKVRLESQTPDLEQRLQVEEHRKADLVRPMPMLSLSETWRPIWVLGTGTWTSPRCSSTAGKSRCAVGRRV